MKVIPTRLTVGLLLLAAAIGCNSSSDPGPSAQGPSAPERSGSASGSVPAGGLIVLNEQNFDEQVLKSKVPVLVDFWATWCGPCRQLAPTIDALATDHAGRIKVGKVDVDKNNALARKYGITGIPAVFMFKDGQVVGQVVGLNSRETYEALIKKAAPPAAKQ
jgi:thioredoxin